MVSVAVCVVPGALLKVCETSRDGSTAVVERTDCSEAGAVGGALKLVCVCTTIGGFESFTNDQMYCATSESSSGGAVLVFGTEVGSSAVLVGFELAAAFGFGVIVTINAGSANISGTGTPASDAVA